MRSLTDQLVNYAHYHRNRRNIATHMVGVPMIFCSLVILLSKPLFLIGNHLALTPSMIIGILIGLYYLTLDRLFGVLMALILAGLCWYARDWSAANPNEWLALGLGLFVVGWAIQALGHYWEGRKPAFFDDLIGLLIGPLFVLGEFLFSLGLRRELAAEIERRAGPCRDSKQNGQSI